MIKTFQNKQLRSLWETGRSKIDSRMHDRIMRRLDRLDAAEIPDDMNLPGFDFHALKGFKPTRYTVHVNGLGASRSRSATATPTRSISSSTTEERKDGSQP